MGCINHPNMGGFPRFFPGPKRQDDMPFVQEIQADPGFFNQVQAPEDRLPINIEIAIETGSLIVYLPTQIGG